MTQELDLLLYLLRPEESPNLILSLRHPLFAASGTSTTRRASSSAGVGVAGIVAVGAEATSTSVPQSRQNEWVSAMSSDPAVKTINQADGCFVVCLPCSLKMAEMGATMILSKCIIPSH